MPDWHAIETSVIRAVLSHIPSPPVDLVDIARRLGVREIRPTPLRDGYTDFRSSSPVIFLNPTQSSSRMRFILAHELAHVILRTAIARCAIQELGQTQLLENEEHFADRIARTILVPDTWVNALHAATYSLDGLQRVAAAADVSLGTLVHRMTGAGINVGLLQWFRGDRDWYVVDRPGTPSCLHGDLRLADKSHLTFERLGSKEATTQFRAYNEGRRVESSGTASRTGREVLYLVESIWCGAATYRYNGTGDVADFSSQY